MLFLWHHAGLPNSCSFCLGPPGQLSPLVGMSPKLQVPFQFLAPAGNLVWITSLFYPLPSNLTARRDKTKQSTPREVFEAKIRDGASLGCRESRRRKSKHSESCQNRVDWSQVLSRQGNTRQQGFAETIEEEESMSQPQGLRWPAWAGRPNMGASGHLVIPESISRLPMKTRPLLPQGGLCPPSEQGSWSPNLTPWFQPAPLTQR